MDLDNDKVLKLIFPKGIPENLQTNPELSLYLTKLGTYKTSQLKRELSRLADETKNVVDQTQELAISNYKTFICTAENSRSIFQEFQHTEDQVNAVIKKLPVLGDKCDDFQRNSAQINEERRLNSITLKKNAELLEILELPQLMERCIREGRYEEALELAAYVQKMGQNHGQIPVINSIVRSVESLWHTMLVQLVAQLRFDLQLPKCLQIVGYLRRMQAFSNNELKLKFIQARESWLATSLKAIPKDDAQQHLTKTIEVTRINLFNIITQYQAIFPEDETHTLKISTGTKEPMKGLGCDGGRLFQAWLHEKIDQFLKTLEFDLLRGVTSFETVLGQCMYFGLSFSRVGADFRPLMAPIFIRVIKRSFENAIIKVDQIFEHELNKFTLINKITLYTRSKVDENLDQAAPQSPEFETYSPPETLLDFPPLASLCNGYLSAFNELRICVPVALAPDITRAMQKSLENVADKLLAFYRREQQAFTENERDIFGKFCACFAYDFLPYIQRCMHAIFPQQTLTNHLAVNLIILEEQRISYLQQKPVLEPLKHLLPKKKVDTVVKTDKTQESSQEFTQEHAQKSIEEHSKEKALEEFENSFQNSFSDIFKDVIQENAEYNLETQAEHDTDDEAEVETETPITATLETVESANVTVQAES